MQTLVCQTAETFSPEILPQPQSLQKKGEIDSPRQSDFLSMLNENVQKEEAAQEQGETSQQAQIAAAESQCDKTAGEEKVQEKEAKAEAPKAKEKAPAKEEPKKAAKAQKVDAFIAGALEVQEPKKVSQKGEVKKIERPAEKKAAAEQDVKIDPKQLEFLRKISEAESSKDQKLSVAKDFSFEQTQEITAAAVQAESLLAGQNVVQEAADFSYAFEEFVQDKDADEPKVGQLRKGEKKPVIQVTDLRTKAEPAAVQKPLEKDARKNFAVSVKETGKSSVEMTMDLNGQQAQKNILSLDGQSAAADGSTFQAMLKNQITQNAGDFVRAANIVLKDGDQGQINLILHPEQLGNVKISMEVHGKSIVGHITVASREALEAFGQSADALKNSFIQSGFEDASFDVSFAGSQMQFAQGQAQEDAQGKARQGRKIYGEFAQESLTSVQEISDNFIDDDVSLNIVA